MTEPEPAPPAASMAVSSPIPFKTIRAEPSTLGGSWIACVLMLTIVAAGLLVFRRRLGRLSRSPRGMRQVTVVESTPLGERIRLSVVYYRDRELLIAHGEQFATVLADEPRAASRGSAL